MRRLCVFLCLTFMLCPMRSCASPSDSRYTCKDLTLSLPGVFEDLSEEPYGQNTDFLLGQDKLIVMGLSEQKSTLKDMDLQTYTALVIQGNSLDCPAQSLNGRYRFTYEAPVEDTLYTYRAVTLETEEHFWIVQCYCPSEDFPALEKMADKILTDISQYTPTGN